MQVALRVILLRCILLFCIMTLLAYPYQAGVSVRSLRALGGAGGGRSLLADGGGSFGNSAAQQSLPGKSQSSSPPLQGRRGSKSSPRTARSSVRYSNPSPGSSLGSRARPLAKRQVPLSRENLSKLAESRPNHELHSNYERNPYREHNLPTDRTDDDSIRSAHSRHMAPVPGAHHTDRTDFHSIRSARSRHRGSASGAHHGGMSTGRARHQHAQHSREQNGRTIEYIFSRSDLFKVMHNHPHLGQDLSNPEVLSFLERHRDHLKLMSSAEYHDYQNGVHSPRKKGSGLLRKMGQHVSGYFQDGNHYLHAAGPKDLEGMFPEDHGQRGGDRGRGPPNDGQGPPGEKSPDAQKKPWWARPGSAFLYGLMGTGIGVGGSVPTMVQGHGYAAQARAQQQGANAATAGAIHNGTMSSDGASAITNNGTSVPIPHVNDTTKHYQKRDLRAPTNLWARRG